MNSESLIQRTFGSFTFMVLSAVIVGLITGGIPYFSQQISTLSLFIAMTVSLTHINVRTIEIKRSEFVLPLLINYGLLSSIILVLGFFFPEDIWNGFVILAAVPPAIAIIPITKILRGDIKFSLVSLTFIYILSLLLTPFIIFFLLGKNVNVFGLVQTIILLLFLPLILSQIIRRINFSSQKKTYIANICFFILIFVLVGKNRSFLFSQITIVFWIIIASFIRTFGTGMLIKTVSSKKGLSYDRQIPLILFGVFKNGGLAILLALSLFGGIAAVPAIIGLIFEMLWVGCFELKIC